MSENEFPKLEPDEEIIKEDSAKLVRNQGATKEKGELVLTNQRILFGRHSSFLFVFFRKTKTVVDVNLDQIKKIKTHGIIGKELQISYTENGDYNKSFFKVSDIDDWVSELEKLTNIE